MDPIQWKRVRGALIQYSREHSYSKRRVGRVMRVLPPLVEMCGDYSKNRRMAVRIGEVILSSRRLHVLVPSCPDYAHEKGRYNFKDLGGGVPLLTRKHLRFLRRIRELIPEMMVTILVADQEAEDLAICKAVGLTQDEFRDQVETSVKRTAKCVHPYGWTVEMMSKFVPDFLDEEARLKREIMSDPANEAHLVSDTFARQDLYRRIGCFTSSEMLGRTARTAAQYMVLGNFAREQGMLVCNHTTTSLSWYLKTRVGLLHDPINVY